jgi:hypothetical protein
MRAHRPAALTACAVAAVAAMLAAVPASASAASRPLPARTEHSNIYNTNSERCLGDNSNRSHLAAIWNCTDSKKPSSNQTWHVGVKNPTNSYYAHIVNGQKLCLSVLNRSTKDGADIVFSKCRGPKDKTQYWLYDTTWAKPAAGTGPGTPKGRTGTGGKVLGVLRNSKGNGTRVVLQANRVGKGRPYAKGQAWYFASPGT